MGQAKQRGTREQRVTLAVQAKEEAEALRIAQESAQRRVMDAAYRSGMLKPGRRADRNRAAALSAALGFILSDPVLRSIKS